MKAGTFVAALVVAGAVGMVGTACAQQGEGQGQQEQQQQGLRQGQRQGGAGEAGAWREPGGAVTMMTAGTAKVKSVDRENRTVTLERPDGTTATYKCGKRMVNFDQIKEGDQVRATMIERVAVSLDKAGEAPKAGEAGMVALAPKGGRPGVILANTDVMNYRVSSIDERGRTVTLVAPGGKSETIKVGQDVDLSKVKKGDDVTVRYTEGLALLDEKGAGEAGAAAPGEAQPAGARIGAAMEGVETTSRTATVESVDPATREVTFKNEAGETRTIRLGKEVRNFDQIKPGDKVKATLAEEMAVDVTKGGEQPQMGKGVVMARTPQGAKPGMLIAETTAVSGKVDSVDQQKHTITLTEEGGKQRTLKVRKGVDLSGLKSGDEVNARVTQAVGILVEKP